MICKKLYMSVIYNDRKKETFAKGVNVTISLCEVYTEPHNIFVNFSRFEIKI